MINKKKSLLNNTSAKRKTNILKKAITILMENLELTSQDVEKLTSGLIRSSQVMHWRLKNFDKSESVNTRNSFPSEFMIVIEQELLKIWEQNQKGDISYFTNMLNQNLTKEIEKYGKKVSRYIVSKIFKSWKFTKKNLYSVDYRKFEQGNFEYYNYYIPIFKEIDIYKFMFVDECSFDPRQFKKIKGYTPRGYRSSYVDLITCNEALRCSLTLIIWATDDENEKGLFYTTRVNSNTAQDFLEYILTCVEKGIIKEGMNVIADNATVHRGSEIDDKLDEVMEELNGKFLFQPKYSPELNPAELIFGLVKNYIRRHPENHDIPFQDLIDEAFSTISAKTVRETIRHVVQHSKPLEMQHIVF